MAMSSAYEQLMAAEPPHPLLPLPTEAQVRLWTAAPPTPPTLELPRPSLAQTLALRRRIIEEGRRDPVRHELEPAYWRDADKLCTPGRKLIAILGGNRSAKSRYCGKRVVQTMLRHPGVKILAVAEDEDASIQTQQAIIWHYLPPEIRELRTRRDPRGVFKCNFSVSGGFSERNLVLPNGAFLKFATYGESPDDYEGRMFGPQVLDGEHPEWNVAWWGDENLRLGFLNMLRRRGQYMPGYGLWSFTPIRGMTNTIKAVVSETRVVKWRDAELLRDRSNVAGGPVGQMPYQCESADGRTGVVYFFTELSPFGPGENGGGERFFEGVRRDCQGKPSGYVKRIAYGYAEDVAARAFPKFQPTVHVIPQSRLPAHGTNYQFVDPAGARSWFCLWARVAPGSPRRIFIYRDWPDCQRHGEWAIPSERELSPDSHKGWDGERGPAQRSQGWGVSEYKKAFWRSETVSFDLQTDGSWADADPHRRRLLDEAMSKHLDCEVRPWTREDIERLPDDLVVRETIRIRRIDPRAAEHPQANERGGVTLIGLLGSEQRADDHKRLAGPMPVFPAYTGKGIDDGLSHVNELLDYDTDQPVCAILNEPRLYVAENCQQVIWAMNHYTGRGGQEGACKEVADLLRYLAQDDDLRHLTGTTLKTGGATGGPV